MENFDRLLSSLETTNVLKGTANFHWISEKQLNRAQVRLLGVYRSEVALTILEWIGNTSPDDICLVSLGKSEENKVNEYFYVSFKLKIANEFIQRVQPGWFPKQMRNRFHEYLVPREIFTFMRNTRKSSNSRTNHYMPPAKKPRIGY